MRMLVGRWVAIRSLQLKNKSKKHIMSTRKNLLSRLLLAGLKRTLSNQVPFLKQQVREQVIHRWAKRQANHLRAHLLLRNLPFTPLWVLRNRLWWSNRRIKYQRPNPASILQYPSKTKELWGPSQSNSKLAHRQWEVPFHLIKCQHKTLLEAKWSKVTKLPVHTASRKWPRNRTHKRVWVRVWVSQNKVSRVKITLRSQVSTQWRLHQRRSS